MKKYLLSTFALLGICAVASNASAGTSSMHMKDNMYGLAELGFGFGQDEYKEQGIMGLGLGAKINDYFRTDVIVSYRGWGKTHFKNSSKDADTWAIPVLANIYGTMPIHEKMGVYAMAGLGYAYNKTKGIPEAGGKGSHRFAWNVGAGVEYKMNDCWTFDLGYRYTDLGKARLKDATAAIKTKEDLKSHDILLTARYNF